MRAHLAISLVMGATLILPSCETAAVAVATPMLVQKRHLNFTNSTFAAIETLVGQTNQKLDPLRPFLVQNLDEIIHEPDKTGVIPRRRVYKNPQLVEVMAEQMSSRLMQLGYRVFDPVSPPAVNDPLYVVFGTFHIDNGNIIEHGGNIQVALQLKDSATGRILSTHTYSIPVTDEVRRYMAEGNVLMPKFIRD